MVAITQFATQTQIGRLFGISSHKVGKVLTEFHFRLLDGRPSSLAWSEGIVQEHFLEDRPFVPFWLWDIEAVAEILEIAGFEEDPIMINDICSAFEARPVGTAGHEIIYDGQVVAWTTNEVWTALLLIAIERSNIRLLLEGEVSDG